MYLRDSTGFWQRFKTRFPITVYESKPIIEALGDTQLYCISSQTQSFKCNLNGVKKYEWSVNNSTLSNSEILKWTPLNSGIHQIDLSIIDEFGCLAKAPSQLINIIGPKAQFEIKAFNDACAQSTITLKNHAQNADELYWYANGNQIGKTDANVDSFQFKLPYFGHFYVNQLAVAQVYDSSQSKSILCNDGFPDKGLLDFELTGAPNSDFKTYRNVGLGKLKFVPEDTTADYYLWFIDGRVTLKNAPGITFWSFKRDTDSISVCLKVVRDSCISETCKNQWINSNSIAENDFKLQVFPNPTNDQVFIKSETAFDRFEVYNAIGQLVKSENKFGTETIIQTNEWQKGIYFLKLHFSNNSILYKIIKE